MSDDRLRLAYAAFHPDRTRKLLDEWGTAGAVLRAIERRQVKASDAVREAVGVEAIRRRAELHRLGTRFLTRDDGDYPRHLAGLPDAPDGLFVRGTLPADRGVAVIGTRRCSAYGTRLATRYGRAIAEAGWTLVSGLARGIDGAAHQGTVAAGGIGVAVLGCGIDVAYPREHAALARDLLDLGGAVVTEYPPHTAPEPWRFPPRNRIISGLAAAVVVVEAGVKGGALITASSALAQGVDVFAVPGDIDRESSRGCNLLIRDGAQPVLDPADLVEELALILGPPPATAATRRGGDPVGVAELLGGGASVDDIVVRLGCTSAEAMRLIGALEVQGAVTWDGSRVIPV
jgi:DNA processing protein